MKSPAKEGQPEAVFHVCVCLIGIFSPIRIKIGVLHAEVCLRTKKIIFLSQKFFDHILEVKSERG